MHKIHFRPGLRPGPRWGSIQRCSEPLVGCRGDTSPHVSSLSTRSASRSEDIQNRGGVIGPHDNVFPGPAVALDGPAVSDAIAYMVKQFVRLIAIQYGLTFCLYAHSLHEAPLHSPSGLSIRQLDLMSKSWNELLRH